MARRLEARRSLAGARAVRPRPGLHLGRGGRRCDLRRRRVRRLLARGGGHGRRGAFARSLALEARV